MSVLLTRNRECLVSFMLLVISGGPVVGLQSLKQFVARDRARNSLFAATLDEPDVQAVVTANTGLDEVCLPDDEICLEFPPALSAPQRTLRALKFYSKVLPVLGAYKVTQIRLSRQADAGVPPTAEEETAIWGRLDEWGSTRIAETIEDLRGFYVRIQ